MVMMMLMMTMTMTTTMMTSGPLGATSRQLALHALRRAPTRRWRSNQEPSNGSLLAALAASLSRALCCKACRRECAEAPL
eukprot:5724205-Lingulodinium_polyedra.AAC.1